MKLISFKVEHKCSAEDCATPPKFVIVKCDHPEHRVVFACQHHLDRIRKGEMEVRHQEKEEKGKGKSKQTKLKA
jgi:hypothetical protein